MVRNWQALLQIIPQWLPQAAGSDLPDDFTDIPAGVFHSLSDKLGHLPTPDTYQKEVQVAFSKALQAWQANPETASNSLVVLSRPVEAIAPILKASLQDSVDGCDIRFFLTSYHRPFDPLTIPGHLQRELEPEKAVSKETPAAPVTQSEMAANHPTVMVIPNLEKCFLRCIQGWEGIEYLQSLSTQDTSRFWVFGCNQWAWAFLDKVCQVGAYLEQVVVLPQLKVPPWKPGWSLCWPLPVRPRARRRTCRCKSPQMGIPTGPVWPPPPMASAPLRSIFGCLAADATGGYLWPTKPVLPSLVSLTVLDRCILHSLLLHGEMTRSHLALSLGEAERAIRSRVQVLRREGMILQRGHRLTVQPAHYPKLYNELGNNNFLIGEE